METEQEQDKEHVAAGTPVPSGPEFDKKHVDNSEKPSDQLEQETVEEFEKHNMTEHRGYNEENNEKMPVKKKNIAKERE